MSAAATHVAQFELIARTELEALWNDGAQPDYELAYGTLIDTLGCICAGIGCAFIAELRGTLYGVEPGWIVCGDGRGSSPRTSALVNAAAAHAQDFDDTQWSTTVHASAVIWGALLALNPERMERNNVALAYETGLRFIDRLQAFIVPNHLRQGWHATGTMGALAAVVAVSRLTQRTSSQTWRALGIAGSLIGGLRQNNLSTLKCMHAGRAAENAILAWQLAALSTFAGEVSVGALGSAFGCTADSALGRPAGKASEAIAFKVFPTCSGTHAAIEAALSLADATLPDSVEVSVPILVAEETTNEWPATIQVARMGLPYTVAVALIFRTVDDEALSLGLADARVRSLFERITVKVERRWPSDAYLPAATLRLRRNGAEFSTTIEHPRGDPARPLSGAELERKMRALSARLWDKERQDKILRAAREFVRGKKLSEFLELVARADGYHENS